MTTQAITSTVGNPTLQREFSATSTDGQWSNVTSTLSSQAVGLELPNVVITSVQMNYAAGGAVARIISGKTLKVKGHILANKTGFACMSESKLMQPIRLASDDLLQVWSVDLDEGSNDTAVVGLVKSSAGVLPFGVNTTEDNTATEILELNTGQGIGDVFFGSTVLGFQIQCEDGALLNKVTIVDSQGGTVGSWYGGVRAQAGSKSNTFNLEVQTKIPVQKGWKMYVYCTSS